MRDVIAQPTGPPAPTGASPHDGTEAPGTERRAGRTRRPVAGWLPEAATAAVAGGVAVALLAQQLVAQRTPGVVVLLVFAWAVALFLAGLGRGGDAGLLRWRGPLAEGLRATARLRVRAPAVRRRPLLWCLGLAGVTFLASGGNRFTALNVTAWVLSVALGLVACWEGDVSREGLRRWGGARWRSLRALVAHGPSLRLSWTAVGLAAVLLGGVLVLFYRIGDVPREMTSDHAEKLLDARDVLDGQHRIFFPRNTGREALQFYLIAAMTPIAGISYLTMKLGTAAVATVTLPFTFLAARVLFGTRVALLATAVLASTRWLWQVGRVGLRFPFPPAFGAATLYFLLKALRDRRRNDFLLLGLTLGLAQHSYTALRFAPVAVLACLALALAVDVWRREPPGRVHRLVADSALMAFIAALVFMPLARYAVDDPQTFLFRGVTRIASDAQNAVPRNLPAIFLDNVKNALLMFNWRGDVVWVNTIPGEPLLDPVSGALFVLGCAYGVYRLARHRELPYLYLFLFLFVGLLPSVLSLAYPGENPSTVRSGMAIPVAVILVSLPLALLVRALGRSPGGPAGAVAGVAALALLLIPMAGANAEQYFRVYATQHTRSSQHTAEVGRVVNGFLALGGRREDVSILPWAHWFDTRLVAIETGDIRWNPLIPSVEEARRADGRPRPRLYVVAPEDSVALERLTRWYPTAVLQRHTLPEGTRPFFVTVLVPPGAVAVE